MRRAWRGRGYCGCIRASLFAVGNICEGAGMRGCSVLYRISTSTVSQKPSGGDDRILIHHLQDQSILVLLADGATGVGFGALAAERFIAVMSDHVTNFS